MKKTFYSNGKLLVTGEYVVLDGAKALALPTKFGQSLEVEENESQAISWKSYDADGTLWFEDIITFDALKTKKKIADNTEIRDTLIEILHEAYCLNPSFINTSMGYSVCTRLTFPRLWGLGTSSTLINNIAAWLNIDPYLLLKNTFGGSGYDIACAQNNNPICYRLNHNVPEVTPVPFYHEFTAHLYFVYLNKKQSSKKAIAKYKSKQTNNSAIIEAISQLTEEIVTAGNLQIFTALIKKHENIMKELLEEKTVQESHFSDFDGVIKSLGAWGGDFVLVVSEKDPGDYFQSKGYSTVISYQNMIK